MPFYKSTNKHSLKIENFVTLFHSCFKLSLSIWHSCVIQDFDEQFMHNLQDILLTSICAFKLCCFEVKTALSLPYLPIVNRCQLQHYLSTDHHFIDIVEKQDFDRKIYCDFCANRLLHSVYSFIGQLIKCDISSMFM